MAGGPTPVGVLALQGDYEAHARALAEIGAAPRLVRNAAELQGLAGLVIPGGESTALLRLLAREGLFQSVRDFATRRPTFGTCAGCILLAREVLPLSQASFAVLDITVERNAYGRQLESNVAVEESVLPGPKLEMVFIRAPRIVRTGPRVEVLASHAGSPALVREGSVLAATFHPELSADRRVHRLFLAMAER
jgi:5'-phosphate synthase pdxT subunit